VEGWCSMLADDEKFIAIKASSVKCSEEKIGDSHASLKRCVLDRYPDDGEALERQFEGVPLPLQRALTRLLNLVRVFTFF